MKTFVFIVFIVIVFAFGNLYNWGARKAWKEMEEAGVVIIILMTALLGTVCGALISALQCWEIVSFNFD